MREKERGPSRSEDLPFKRAFEDEDNYPGLERERDSKNGGRKRVGRKRWAWNARSTTGHLGYLHSGMANCFSGGEAFRLKMARKGQMKSKLVVAHLRDF